MRRRRRRRYRIDPSQAAGAVTTGASNLGGAPLGIAFDESRIWTANNDPGSVSIVTPGATIPWTVTTVTTGFAPGHGALFDGTNVWVPTGEAQKLVVVRASSGAVLATLTGNGLSGSAAAFDGQRVLVTGSDSVSLWKAADLTPLGSFGTGAGTGPNRACSDGVNFWITLEVANKLARF